MVVGLSYEIEMSPIAANIGYSRGRESCTAIAWRESRGANEIYVALDFLFFIFGQGRIKSNNKNSIDN